jgi:hypothetical protein
MLGVHEEKNTGRPTLPAATIDLNPVRAGMVQDPKDYRWSGYGQYDVLGQVISGWSQTDRVFNPPATETFAQDAGGNLTQDGRWTYTWDEENRRAATVRSACGRGVYELSV